jgi:hypothetical protein
MKIQRSEPPIKIHSSRPPRGRTIIAVRRSDDQTASGSRHNKGCGHEESRRIIRRKIRQVGTISGESSQTLLKAPQWRKLEVHHVDRGTPRTPTPAEHAPKRSPL